MRPSRWALALALALAGRGVALIADAKTPEALAGEDDKAVPTALPTPADDSRGPVGVTRSAQAAPAFQLPDLVVTGSGERKALARRDDEGGALDTSGGLRTSPGEKGAGKDQLATEAQRSAADDVTYTVRSDDAWLRAAYGLADTASLDAYLGRASGPWTWSVQAGAHNTDGGPVPAGLDLAQARDEALKGSLSFADGSQGLWEAGVLGEDRARRWTQAPEGDGWIERQRQQAQALWSGLALGATAGLQVGAEHASELLSGQGADYSEEGGSLGLDLEKTVYGRTGQTTLSGDASVEALSQRAAGQRQILLWKGELLSRFEPFKRARLTVGLGLDAATGDSSSLLLGPRLEWQQRFSPAWGFHASFRTGLDASRLNGDAWDQDLRLPDPRLPVSRRTADLDAGLQWQGTQGLGLEAGVFAKQNEGYFLPDDPAHSGLWVDSPVDSYRQSGVEAKQRWEQGGWWQELSARYLNAQLTDLNGVTPTFAPAWTGRLALGARQGPWHGSVSLDARSQETTSLRNGGSLPAAGNLSAQLSYDWSRALTLFAEGRNLAAAPWGPAPGYPDPSPYAGLGLEIDF
jgi:hypothetical protein